MTRKEKIILALMAVAFLAFIWWWAGFMARNGLVE